MWQSRWPLCRHRRLAVEDLSGVTFSRQSALLDWETIHDRWARDLIEFPGKTDSREIPYVHTEHGNTTQFAISASNAGYAAIREVSGNREDKGAKLDLILVSNDTVYLIEAKWLEFSFNEHSKVEDISVQLNRAEDQVRIYSNTVSRIFTSGRAIRRVAVSYVTPFSSEQAPFDERNLYDLLSRITESVQPDMLSWVFPARMRDFSYWVNRVYPGVIVVARHVGKQ